MPLKQYLLVMIVTTCLCWIVFFYIIFSIDPSLAGFLGFVFFYLSLFLSLVGTGSIFTLIFRLKQGIGDLPVFKMVTISFRQGIWVAIFFTTLLFLQEKNFLNLWSVLSLVFILSALEMFLNLKRR